MICFLPSVGERRQGVRAVRYDFVQEEEAMRRARLGLFLPSGFNTERLNLASTKI
jgi:hypothetical protein